MRAKRAKNPTWECCSCAEKIKYGDSYTWWWMPNLVRCDECTANMKDLGTRYEQGVREKPVRMNPRLKKPIPGQTSLLEEKA